MSRASSGASRGSALSSLSVSAGASASPLLPPGVHLCTGPGTGTTRQERVAPGSEGGCAVLHCAPKPCPGTEELVCILMATPQAVSAPGGSRRCATAGPPGVAASAMLPGAPWPLLAGAQAETAPVVRGPPQAGAVCPRAARQHEGGRASASAALAAGVGACLAAAAAGPGGRRRTGGAS